MEKVLVFGHKNPDTDTICSAIAYSELKNKLGFNTEPVRLGAVNSETQFALDHFQQKEPRLVDSAAQEVKNVILVDHNEQQQSVDDIKEVSILEVIDHHRVANFETKDPLYMRIEPVGCTATILHKMYQEHNVTIEKETAGLLLSAIISDSLLFKSPTCTQQDIDAAKELGEIAEVDVEGYGLEMLKAGASVSDKTVEQLITLDAKEFQMGNAKVEIAQVNTVDTDEVFSRQQELEEAISQVIKKKDSKLFVLVVTDILANDSVVLALGEAANHVEKAFDVTLDNNTATLTGVVSRKKQVVPPLTDTFA